MLTPEECREIEAEFSRYPTRQAISVDALKVVQKHRGWVSDEALRDLAEFLSLPVADLESVATFYNLIFREPVGRHVILICDSVSCWIMGYQRLRQHLATRLSIGLGETSADGRFTLLPIVCLGACDHAPAIMIDNRLYGDLDSDKVDQALEEHR